MLAMDLTKYDWKHLSRNEINNIIYLCFKYSFKIESPSNNEIQEVLLEVVDDTSCQSIIKAMFKFIQQNHSHTLSPIRGDQEDHVRFIITEFLKLPDELREDLGVDGDAEEFVLKH
jgi:hypothetical protein